MGLTAATLNALGFKEVTFKDGQTIRYNNTGDSIYNIFMGNMGHQLLGKITFTDEANEIVGWYEPGTYKFKTQDYLHGRISVKGKKVCDIYGNYMGFLDFNKERYWDIRDMVDKVWFPIVKLNPDESLASDSTKRIDSMTLQTGDIPAAQQAKEELE